MSNNDIEVKELKELFDAKEAYSDYLQSLSFKERCHSRALLLRELSAKFLREAGLKKFWDGWAYLSKTLGEDFMVKIVAVGANSIEVEATCYDYDDFTINTFDLLESEDDAEARVKKLIEGKLKIAKEENLTHLFEKEVV